LSPSPSSREAARMANERPLNLVQLVADYFYIGTFSEISMCILYFVEIFNYYYGNSEMVSYHNSIFNLTVN
ncbi:hypothetical protein, partial [Lactiplantibacillus plantarum]|uniref:hypothetical protein n=1 Tax=Lactiplantibacillus plantarum TaxID=1590 RepID=UPI001F18BE52